MKLIIWVIILVLKVSCGSRKKGVSNWDSCNKVGGSTNGVVVVVVEVLVGVLVVIVLMEVEFDAGGNSGGGLDVVNY